jgi:hypothetical protein
MVNKDRSLFAVHEYELAFRQIAFDAINALMLARDPVLQMIPVERKETIGTVINTMPSGEVVEGPPIQTATTLSICNDDVISTDVDGLLSSFDAAAEEAAGHFVPKLFERLGRICDAAGTSVDAKGQRLSWDLLLDGFDAIQIDFDEHGQAQLPTLVMHPDMRAKLGALPPPTDVQTARMTEIMERKRNEFNARKRARRLS